jgi:hypothetical protein
MNGWQIAIIAIWSVGIAISIIKHGEPRDAHNLFIDLPVFGLVIWVYIKAGLFS